MLTDVEKWSSSTFTDGGKREIKYLPEHLVEGIRKFERRRGAFRKFESWR